MFVVQLNYNYMYIIRIQYKVQKLIKKILYLGLNYMLITKTKKFSLAHQLIIYRYLYHKNITKLNLECVVRSMVT